MVRHFRIDSPKTKKGKVKKEEPPKASGSCSSEGLRPKPYAKAKAFLDAVASQREQETKKLKRENTDELDVVYESDWSHLAHGHLKQPPGQNGNESPSPESQERKESNLRSAKFTEALGRRLEEERRGGAARGKNTRGRSPNESPLENLHESPSKPSSVDRRVVLGVTKTLNDDFDESPSKPSSVDRRAVLGATKTLNDDFDESPSKPSSVERRFVSGAAKMLNLDFDESPSKPSSVERRVAPGTAKTANGELLEHQPPALKGPFYKFLRSETETGTFPTRFTIFPSLDDVDEDPAPVQHASSSQSSVVKDHDSSMVSETSTTDSPQKEVRKRTQLGMRNRPPGIKDPADLSVMSESSTIGSPEEVFNTSFGITTPLFGNTPTLFGNTTSAFRSLSQQRRASLASYASAQSTFSNESSSPRMLSPPKAPATKTIYSYPNTTAAYATPSSYATPSPSYATPSPFHGFLCDTSTVPPIQKSETPSPSPPTPFRSSQGDTSLVPPIQQHAETDDWKGWLPVADKGGSLFFYHVPTETSAWEQPPELSSVLGEWEMIEGSEHQSGPYWHNALLKASVWRDPAQVTSIFQAAMDNNVVFLQLYAHVNGDFDAVDGKGRRALHYACASGSVQACQMIIHFKATLDAPDYNKSSPLLFAARYGYSSLCRLLIDSRASVNVKNSLGDSCLHEAAQLGQVDCVVLLLLVKADCEAKNSRNLLPEEVAKANKHVECSQILHQSLLKQQRLADCGGNEGEESGVSDPSEDEVESEDSEDEKPNVLQTPNRTTKNLVQRMQPILKGVQGAVNTLFPIKADLGLESRFYFDDQLNEWVLR